jgi:hypothetical protein
VEPEVHAISWPNGANFDPSTLHDWPDQLPAMKAYVRRWKRLPPEGVVTIYRKARRELLGDHKYRRIEGKGLKMIRFVAGFEEPPKGRSLLAAWNNTEWVKKNPRWSYDEGKPGESSRFWKHYHRARRALAHTKRSERSSGMGTAAPTTAIEYAWR